MALEMVCGALRAAVAAHPYAAAAMVSFALAVWLLATDSSASFAVRIGGAGFPAVLVSIVCYRVVSHTCRGRTCCFHVAPVTRPRLRAAASQRQRR